MSGLAPWPFGMGLALVFGERSGLTTRPSLRFVELGPERGNLVPQLGDLIPQGDELLEQLSDEALKCLFPELGEFLNGGHTREFRITA